MAAARACARQRTERAARRAHGAGRVRARRTTNAAIDGVEWWDRAHGLMVKHGMPPRQLIPRLVREAKMQPRPGALELLKPHDALVVFIVVDDDLLFPLLIYLQNLHKSNKSILLPENVQSVHQLLLSQMVTHTQ